MKWEYMSVDSPSRYDLVTELDRLGRQGWELVSVVGGNNMRNIAFLKRPVDSGLVKG